MSEYSEKFKNPQWQKMRLKILERDNWSCQRCDDIETTLHVHHRYYIKNKEPWEYPLEALVTLCEDCHEEETRERKSIEQSLLHALRERFFVNDISDLAISFHMMECRHIPSVVASVYSWAIENKKAQDILIKMYFKYLHNKNKGTESSEE